jgi:predicted transcriptional regulator
MQTKLLVDRTIEVLKNIPPNSNLEDIMHELHLTDQVLQGLEDAEQGRVISTDELLKRIQTWRKG